MKKTMLKLMLPLVAATWTDAFRRVCNRIALVAAAICAAAAPLSSFAAAKEATLKTTYSGSTLTGFQVLVKLSEGDDYGFSYNEAGSASHYIWFTSEDGTTVYPHEIDKWDTSGDSFVWVRLPELASGTTFKMHWSDSAGDVQSASGNVNVWDGYVGVWHMNETGTTAEPDSTGHGLTAAPINNSSASININTDTNGGQVGDGRAVTQATMLKVTGHNSNNRLSNAQQFTISGWVKKTTDGGEYPRIFVGNVDGNRTQWEVYGWTDSKKDTKTYVRGSGNTDWATTGIILNSASGWHYLTVVYNGTTATIYDKGVSKNSAAINAAAQGGFFTIGGWTGKNNRSFVGTFDEVRMYNGVLSAERIAADYATMNAPTEFLVPASQPTATWTGAAGDGNPATASNWNYYEGSETPIAKVPDSETIVTIAGNSVNLQIPANSTFACKEFKIGDCTFTANCDWRGLSQTPTIDGTANLNGHVLKLNDLSAETGSAFSGGDGSFVEFVVDESATIANLYEYTYIENIDNLTFSGSAKVRLLKKDGNGTLTVTRLELGNKRNGEMVQATGTVNLGNAVNAIGENSGKTARYTMSGGTLTTGTGSELQVGANGTGEFIQTGGDVTIRNWGSIGRFAGTGTYTISGGTLTTTQTGRPVWIGGDNASGRGTLNISGTAVVTLAGGIDAGRNYSSHGYINQNGGTLNIGNANEGFNIGRDAIAEYVQNAGDLVVNPVFRLAWGTGSNVSGTYTLNGGTATLKNTFYVGVGKNGVFTQNGGKMSALAGIKIAEGSSGIGTFTLSGGVLETTFLRKGAGTLNGITFDGGTIVATNVTDGANFISGLNNVKYGPGGLTLDTADFDVTMATASGANVLAAAGSTFTKTGSGTLTVAAVPPVGNMAVSSGTLALSATCDNASMLAHRWSFASDLTDSVTGTAGTMSGSGASYEDGVVKLPGGNKNTCYIDLGANKLPSDSVTIEAWFTLRSQVDWTRVFVIGGSSGHFTVFNSRRSDNGNACNFDSLNGTQIVNTSGKVLAKDTPYYVAVTYTPDGNGGVIEKQYVKKVGDSEFIWNYTVTKANWSVTANAAQGYFWLGHSNGNDKDTNIDFDEVRVWSGALDDTAIALSVEKGADATAADIAEIVAANAVPVKRTLELASGTTLDIGAGNTLTQPVVSGSGTVQNGTLNVTEKLSPGGDGVVGTIAINSTAVVTGTIRLDAGDAITTTGSVDLSNATIDLAFTPTEGSTVATASGSGTFTGVPAFTVNGETSPNGWQFVLSDDGKTISIARREDNAPDAYLEYVESDGRQWVNLSSLKQTATMTFDADMEWKSDANNAVFIGQSWHARNMFMVKDGTIRCMWFMGDTYAPADTGVSPGDGQRHRFVVTSRQGQKLSVTVDGGTPVYSANNSDRSISNPDNQSLYLFAQHLGGGSDVGNYSSVKLYGLKVYGANGGLVLDLVPGIKNGVAGLYDRQNDEWHHSGSGIELIPGPVVNPQNLPDVYLDYVKSTGEQWVSVGITPTQTMKFDVDVDWISGNALMAQSNYGLSPLTVNNGTIVSRWWMADAAASANTGVKLDTGRRRFVITTSNSAYLSASVDGGTPALSGGYSNRDKVNPSDLYIFAVHYGTGGAGDYSTAKLYGLKIYGANGALMRDYVPGIKDNVVGLYDRVNDKFFSSGTSTPLVAGPVVDRSKPDSFVEYVESNSSQWVDTGVDGRAGVKSEADIDWISGNAPLGVIGGGNCLLLQALGTIGGQALGSGEVKTGVELNSGRHLIVSEAPASSTMTVTVDGTTTESAGNVSASGNTGMTIWMFAAHGSGGKWGEGASKFYELKLWRTGSDGVRRIQRHFIPCVKGGRAGLYDAVSGVIFYSHSGTDLVASSTPRTLSVWRNEADDASLDNAANWCGGLPNGTDAVVCAPWLQTVSTANDLTYANLTVDNGAAIDLSGHTLTLTGLTGANSGSFVSGAAVTLDLSGRTDLRTIAKSANPYVVTWESQPSATFTLDSESSRRFKIEPDATGVKIIYIAGGAMLIVY